MQVEQLAREYPLGHKPNELNRLSAQARLCDPFTRVVFHSSGLTSGMRVLDVGSGGGDVAFLAAQIVGPEGEVIGTDRSSSALAWARQRASDLRFSNVRFLQGDPVEMSFNKPFDAVIGRSVLMYYPSPVEALRKLARHLRADGVIAFQEIDCGGARAVPPL